MHTRAVDVPGDTEGAPADVDEFLESALLANLPFSCGRCDSSIAAIVAVNVKELDLV